MKAGHILRAVRHAKWREFAVAIRYCPLCDAGRIILRLQHNAISVRCLACRATAVTMSLVAVLRQLVPDLSSQDVYELSSRGPLVDFLRNKCRTLTCSEFYEGVAPGEFNNGVQCQDVQMLTFPDNSFDLCTSTEVFEHVPDDLAGFAQIRRVLRPGGLFLFTVPIFPSPATVERARLHAGGKIDHLLAPQYHRDPIRGHGQILVYRDYGRDIIRRIEQQGFAKARLLRPAEPPPYGYSRTVIAAWKAGKPCQFIKLKSYNVEKLQISEGDNSNFKKPVP